MAFLAFMAPVLRFSRTAAIGALLSLALTGSHTRSPPALLTTSLSLVAAVRFGRMMKEEQQRRFEEAVRDGAMVFAHPDTIAEIIAHAERLAVPTWGTRLLPNHYLKPGTLIAVRDWKLPAPEFRWKPEPMAAPSGPRRILPPLPMPDEP